MNLYNLLSGEITQKELLNYYNATIIYEKLPIDVNGFVFQYDNIYFITINNNLSYGGKKNTIIHELAHIELCQFNQIDKDLFSFKIDKYEDDADRYITSLLNRLESHYSKL